MNEKFENQENSQVIEFLRNLDSRVSRLESRLNIAPNPFNEVQENESISSDSPYTEPDAFESKLGEYWFANFGILILAVAVVLLLTAPFENLPPFVPSLFGFMLTGAVIYVSHMLKKSFQYISNYLVGTGLVLAFFSTLRLFHFTSESSFQNPLIETILLLSVSAICLIISIKKNSPYLTSLSLTIVSSIGIIIGDAYLIFALLIIVSGLFVYFQINKTWKYVLLFGMSLVYFTHFVWAINNPFLGNEIKILIDPKINLLFIIIYASIFSLGNFVNKNITAENNTSVSNSMINALGSFTLFQIIAITNFQSDIIIYELIYFAAFLAISMLFWIISKSKYSTATYSLVAFLSLSIAIIASTKIPDVFILLIWQCILVSALAIWYQSKTITVTNFLIFLVLFFIYLFSAGGFSIISLSFGIVALISARILNWQKKRLTLKTEFMRNIYLAIAFISIPFTLLKSLPNEYIAISWLAVSVVYYLLSVLLKNFKYRWMGHLTLLGTIFYTMIFGLTGLDSTFKIITLSLIGIVTFLISMLYTRLNLNLKSDKEFINNQ